MIRRLSILLIFLLAAMVPALGADVTGVVVVPGLQGMPWFMVTSRLEKALRSAGYQVEAPQMCWSQYRVYNATSIDCQRDTDAAVDELRAAGAHHIFIAGMSQGGNAAFSYPLTHPALAGGIIALAPAADAAKTQRDPV